MHELNLEIISIDELLAIVKKNLKVLIIIPLITTIISFISVFYLIQPKYTVYTKVFIGKDESEEVKKNYSNDDIQMYIKLLKTYAEIVHTNKLVINALDHYNINLSPGEVLSNLSCTPTDETQILVIKYENSDKELAKNVVSAVTHEFIDTARKLIPNGTVEMVENVVAPSAPSKPNKKIGICIGFLTGLVISIIIIFLTEFFDDTFKNKEKLKRISELPVLGVIPDEFAVARKLKRSANVKKRSKKYISNPIMEFDSTSVVSEAYRTLQTNIKYNSSNNVKTLLVTSSQLQEGKSTVVSNLGLCFAEEYSKVIIVDCDLRNPTIHKKFNIDNKVGLSEILQNETPINNAIQKYSNNLSIITAGNISEISSSMFSSDAMNKLIDNLKNEYNLVIFDSAPVLAVSDAQILSTKVDATLMVVRYASSKISHVLECKNLLNMVDANLTGTVLHCLDASGRTYYYSAKQYGKK